MIEHEHHWALPIEGRIVDALLFRAYLLELHVTGEAGNRLTLRIESPFSWQDAAGTVSHLDPQGPVPALAPILATHGATVEQALAYKDGKLALRFAGGGRLEVPADAYEAWQLASSAGLLVVSVAGGNSLAIWSEP